MRNDLKSKKWQDVTLEELNSQYEMGFSELPTPLTFHVARYMNSYSYGVHGDGIDVRCSHADEAVEIYYSSVYFTRLKEKFISNDWTMRRNDKWNSLFEKGDTRVTLHIDCGEVGYMECDFITDKSDSFYSINDYYDVILHEENNEIDSGLLNNKVLRCLLEASHYINEESNVAERFLNGNETFTEEDCVRLIKGNKSLNAAIELLKKSQPLDKEEIMHRIANMSLEEFNKFINDYNNITEKNIMVYPFSVETIAKAVEEGNTEGLIIYMEIGRLQDNYIVVEKRYNDYDTTMRIVGLSDNYESWNNYFGYETIAETILKNKSLLEAFKQYK